MPELENVEKPKVAGFVSRERNKGNKANQERINQDEKELAELLAQREKEVEEAKKEDQQASSSVSEDTQKNGEEKTKDTEEQPLSREETTFKKRHADLRKAFAAKEKEWNKRFEELESQLKKATNNQLILPKSEEEMDAWITKYPDVAATMHTMADKISKNRSEELDKRLSEIEKLREEAAIEKAEAELLKLHPDFTEIRQDDSFHDWAEAQPKLIQDILYENASDAKAVAKVINLYKTEKGISNTSKANSAIKDAAKSVKSNRSVPQKDESESYFRESQIQKMSDKEYEANQEAILQATREKKIIYDVSGGAR
tara:strand:+ start:343 stop:1284 length:942 start_codon:yes stop_codon:yes gene_type:complete